MKNRRRKRLVQKPFQLRVILTYALMCVVGIYLGPGIFYVVVSRKLEALKWMMTFRADPATDIIGPALLSASVSAVIFTVAALFIVSRQLKSKTAESLERIMEDLETIAEGNLSVAPKPKEQYFFQAVSKELSQTVITIRRRLMKTYRNFMAVKHTIDALPDIKEELLPEKCAKITSEVRELKKLIRG